MPDPDCDVCAGNLPMFPRNLADGLFSLHVGRPTAAMSVHMTIHPDGSLDECGLVASTVIPTRKLTYDEVDELLDQTMPEQEPTLWALNKVWHPPPPPGAPTSSTASCPLQIPTCARCSPYIILLLLFVAFDMLEPGCNHTQVTSWV